MGSGGREREGRKIKNIKHKEGRDRSAKSI
jgi:hypothetical protein